MNSFKTQDMLYRLFTEDVELMKLMGSPDGDEDKNARFRREECDITDINADSFPFLTILFLDTEGTQNYLINEGLLELNIYSSGRYPAMKIYERVRELLRLNCPEMKIVTEGQVYTEIRGVYCYRVRYNPLINS